VSQKKEVENDFLYPIGTATVSKVPAINGTTSPSQAWEHY
jgi:hypothetical protein